LINGVKIIDPQTGHHVLNLPIDLDAIERIEIVKGGAGRIYGQGALAGAINIVTKPMNETKLFGEVMLGEFGLKRGKIGLNIKGKKSKTYASYTYENADPGYRVNNYFTRHTAFLQSDIKLKKSNYSFIGAYVDNEFGANSFYAAPFDSTSYERVKTAFASLQARYKVGATNISPSLSIRNNIDNYIFIFDRPDVYENLHHTNVINGTVNFNTVVNKFSALGYGLEYRDERITSNNLGDHERSVFTANIEYKLYLLNNKLKLIPGASYNYYSDYGSRTLYGIDASYSLTKKLSTFVNVGTTYRIPSYTELYYSDGSNVGNENLQEESATSYELGLKYVSNKYFFQISGFRRNGTDIIDWTKTPIIVDTTETLKWRPDNITQLPVQGIDISSVVNLNKISFLSPLQKIRMAYTYLDASAIQVDGVESRYALENLRHQYSLSTYWGFLNMLKFSSNYRYVDRVETDPYGLWDYSFGIKYKGLYIDVTVVNAFNNEYEEYPGIPMSGRWVRTSLRYTIDK
jgi:iron complex outermembrane receptor protein